MNKTIYTESTSKASEHAADASVSSIQTVSESPAVDTFHSRPSIPIPQTLEEKKTGWNWAMERPKSS